MHTFVTVRPVEARLTVADVGVDGINARCSVLTWITRTFINVC